MSPWPGGAAPTLAVLLLAVGVAACGDHASATEPTRPGATPYIDRTEIEGPNQPAAVGDTVQLRVFAVLSDGTRQDVTTDAQWSVVDERVIRVARGGLATAVGPGATGIFASYRNVATRVAFGIRVIRPPDEPFHLTAVVRDEHGDPIAGARLAPSGEGDLRFGITDGNGFADLGTGAGRATVTATRLGYADGTAAVSGVTGLVQLTLWLVANPGLYIERHIEDVFDAFDMDAQRVSRTYRIVTRAGGVFDAEADGDHCDYNGTLQIHVRSGTASFAGAEGTCYARLRFVVPNDELFLTVLGNKATTFRLTYREPR
jgi:hypothetical protein